MAKKKSQQQLLAHVVMLKGSERAVSKELGCSQQSVSAWIKCEWTPRPAMQRKLKELYKIPMPWVIPEQTKVRSVRT